MNTSLSKEEVVRKAWDVRDSAVKRKNSAEIELAKERIAGMQINSQLLEAIQQKVELSQQLEQWQVQLKSDTQSRTLSDVFIFHLNFRLTWSKS